MRYQVPVSGRYRLSVMVGANGSIKPGDRRHLRGSPFEVAVHTGGDEMYAVRMR